MSKITETPQAVFGYIREHLSPLNDSPDQNIRMRQDFLRENYTGQIAIIGAFRRGLFDVDEKNATRIAEGIREKEIIRGFGTVGLRAMVPGSLNAAENKRNQQLTHDVDHLSQALTRQGAVTYPYVAPLHAAVNTPNSIDVNYTVLDRGLMHYEEDSASINDDPLYNPKSFLLVMRPLDAMRVFPGSFKYESLENGGVVVLDEVGRNPEQNIWTPLNEFYPSRIWPSANRPS